MWYTTLVRPLGDLALCRAKSRRRHGVQRLTGAEFGLTTGSYGLPTLTCFVPGLDAGSPFNISLHSWGKPEPSEYTQSYTQHAEACNWEARVFVDGRLLSYVPRFPQERSLTKNDELTSFRCGVARHFSIASRNGPSSSVAALVITRFCPRETHTTCDRSDKPRKSSQRKGTLSLSDSLDFALSSCAQNIVSTPRMTWVASRSSSARASDAIP